ncbi:hypothetical protein [Maricaulis sp.]|nr:hypothetical protein [Maricaulis sp.]
MAEVRCWALWDMDEPSNISPSALGVSEELTRDIDCWSEEFDSL